MLEWEGEKKELPQDNWRRSGYTIKCETCESDNINSVYRGETSRTLYSRLTEHVRALKNGREDNSLTKHKQTMHGEGEVEYVYEPDQGPL